MYHDIKENMNLFIDTLCEKKLIDNKYINHIKNYYFSPNLQTKIVTCLQKLPSTGIQYSKLLLILFDILFQNNIVNNDNKIILITNTLEHTNSVFLLNEFLYPYDELITDIYIDNPLNIMNKGGNFSYKLDKYRQKYTFAKI
jgi:hypothetical protein